jgi:hypothetical protein
MISVTRSPELLVRCYFGGGAPKAPPPPVPPPSNLDAASNVKRQTNVYKKGRASTILGGATPGGAGSVQTDKKTLLGG